MANILLKEKAQSLRQKQGASIKQISDQLKVSKSTVSYWCRDIILSKDQVSKLLQKQRTEGLKGSLEYAEKVRRERIKKEKLYKKMGRSDVKDISHRELFMLGLALYWAEGYKKGNTEVGFTNSDPAMITLILRWFREIYGINSKNFIFRVSINQIHEKRADRIIKFWSGHLSAPPSQFTKTSFIKSVSKKVYSNSDNYFGVLRVKVRRGVNLRNRILGAIEYLSQK